MFEKLSAMLMLRSIQLQVAAATGLFTCREQPPADSGDLNLLVWKL